MWHLPVDRRTWLLVPEIPAGGGQWVECVCMYAHVPVGRDAEVGGPLTRSCDQGLMHARQGAAEGNKLLQGMTRDVFDTDKAAWRVLAPGPTHLAWKH